MRPATERKKWQRRRRPRALRGGVLGFMGAGKATRYGAFTILFLVGLALEKTLTARGYEWQTVCQGEGRVYRLRSTDWHWLRRSGAEHSRALHFLGADEKTRYYTDRYVWRSRKRDGVWRFRYNPEDRRFFGVKDQAAVLYGDEQTFEIAVSLERMFLVRKAAPPLTLPCVPRKKHKHHKHHQRNG